MLQKPSPSKKCPPFRPKYADQHVQDGINPCQSHRPGEPAKPGQDSGYLASQPRRSCPQPQNPPVPSWLS
ncbi:uncharacterized protein BDZ83DRAFT_603418 [Colletotrichum acutatum]|uniref:Uncharacterized protein n=1 Tax=Glomerella acutata TaxID=27357 RepID=A0AAD9D118_GLOAC|nr:uncharacterized protein BDZ83DRAFT_603418 [Colletotrichum acutatum]KAK1730177.1 hypothetical protein BDZ83DRAFT_603418 [Colletotrichum acutatum]